MSPARRDAASRLLDWFDAERRDLPWRRGRCDYTVAVSELMLQQTTVAAAAPRFERFVARFPDWRSLAAATTDEVLAEWAGLGYYRRARNLHAMAQGVVADHGGRFPRDAAAARRLPGVGPYTAGAILSLAHDLPVPAVDGNVARVVSRLLGSSLDPARASDRRRIEDEVLRLMPADSPGAFNEALIELGATTCLPRNPRCQDCPLERDCMARHEGTTAEIPRTKRTAWRDVAAAAAVVERRGRVLVVRRPDEADLLAGLWELPGDWCHDGETAEAVIERRVLPALGGGRTVEPAATVKHVITNRRITLRALHCELDAPPRASSRRRWVTPSRPDPDLALTTATARVLAAIC